MSRVRTLTGTGAPTTGVASGTLPYWDGDTALAAGDEVLCANGVAFDPNGVPIGAGRPAQPTVRPVNTDVATAPSGTTALATASYFFAYTVVDTNGLESIESVLSLASFSATNGAAPPRWTFPAGFWNAIHPGIASINVYLTDGTTNQAANLRLVASGITPGTTFVDFTAAYNAGNATPPNGAIRFTHANGVLAAGAVSGLPFLLRGDVVHAATTGMTTANANSVNGTSGTAADARVSQIQVVGNDGRGITFDYSTTVWGSETPYGFYLSAGLRTGVAHGLALIGVQDGTLNTSAGTRPFITANLQGTWRQTAMQFSSTSTGRHRLKDAALSNCADQPLHKTTSQGAAVAPTGAPTVAVAGGGATGGSLAATAANSCTVTYAVAYAWQYPNGDESALSPWSAFFTIAAGNIPRVTCPDTVPAGAAYLLLYLRTADADPALHSFARYVPTANGSPRTSVTPGSSNTTVDCVQALLSLNQWPGPARIVRGLSVGEFSAGIEASTTRTLVTRSGRAGLVTTSGAPNLSAIGNSDIQIDDTNEFLFGADAPWAFLGGSAPTSGAQTTKGSIHRNSWSPITQNPNGATYGTTTDPVFTHNYIPTITGSPPVLATSRAFVRYTRAPNCVWPGNKQRWYSYVDGTDETPTGAPNRQAATLAKALTNTHGISWNAGLTAQSFDHTITDSACCGTGTGDWHCYNASPTGASAGWRSEFNIMLPDNIDQDRSVGDIQGSRAQTAGGFQASTILRWAWNNNTIYRGPNGEPQGFHVNETGYSPGMVDTFTKNVVWGPPGGGVPGTIKTRLISDFGAGSGVTSPTVTLSDWNLGWNVNYGAGISVAGAIGNTSTNTAGAKGMNMLQAAFSDANSDAHSLINVDPGFRAPWRNLITFYWTEKRAARASGYAVGATRPSGATVSDGTARNDTICVEDVREAMAFLVEHAVDPASGRNYARWFWRNYVAADGVTYTHLLDALEAHIQWGLAPTAAAVNPANVAGNQIGALAWVSTGGGVTGVSVTPASSALAIAGTQPLAATVTGTGSPSQAVTWSSSAPGVATVDGAGLVTAVGPGLATITATSVQDPTQHGTATITVAAAPGTRHSRAAAINGMLGAAIAARRVGR